MRILIVHEVNYLSKIIYEFQILPETLAILGHEITVVDYDDSWMSDSGGHWAACRTRVHPGVHRAYSEAAVTVCRPGMIRLPLLSRVSASVSTFFQIDRLLSEQRFDAVLLYGLPTVGVQALLLARQHNVPIYFRSIDILHRLVPFAPLVPVTKLLEGFVYRNVDAITAVTPLLQRHIESYGVDASRIRVLPSGVDAQMFSPGPRNYELMANWGVGPDSKIALFMGTIYRFSGLNRVIRDWPRLLRIQPKAKLLIVGVGEDEQRLKSLARELGLEDSVIFAGLQAYGALPDLIRSSDVCINPFELNPITQDILPTKLFQYLCCGKPVLATRLPGTIPFLGGEEHGVRYAELDTFVDALADMLLNPDSMARLGESGARRAAAYDWKQIARQLVEWMDGCRGGL